MKLSPRLRARVLRRLKEVPQAKRDEWTKRLISACADLAILEMEIEETLGLGRKAK